MKNAAYLNKYKKTYRREIFLAIFFLSLESIFSLLIFYILGNIIDYGVRGNDLNYIFSRGGLMTVITIFMAICTVIRNRYSSLVSQNFGSDLRLDLYEKIQAINLSFDLDKSQLLTRLTMDVDQVQGFVHSLLRVFFKAPLLALGSIVLSFFLSPKLALVLLIFISLAIYLIYKNLSLSYPLFVKIQARMDRLNLVLNEYLSGIQVVKAFNMQKYEREKFREVNLDYMEANIQALNIMAMFVPFLSLILNIGLLVIIYIGGINVSRAGLKIGVIVGFINYMGQILFGLIILSRFLNRGLRAKTSLERIGEVFQLEEEDFSGRELVVNYDIEFKNLYFKYKGYKEYSLENISLKIKEGESIGIIGSTGSGKSTLVKLLLGFYRPSKGDIRIGDRSIMDLDLKNLRANIGLVSQEPFLYGGNIGENIGFFKEGDFEKYADIAGASGFIEAFKEGYETEIGEKGVKLSGGQKQRLTIARALFKEPRIIILDDSSSNLDMTTEKLVRENIFREFGHRTLLIISQRINSVRKADKILVLDKGRLEAFGCHHDLIKTSKVYQDIYNSQLGGVVYED